MRAITMFKKLGFEKDIDSCGLIRYSKHDFDLDYHYYIFFFVNDKGFQYNMIRNNILTTFTLDIDIINAIRIQVEELGWLS